MSAPLRGIKQCMAKREVNQRVVRLRDELQCMLDMGVHAREALQNELEGLVAQKRLFIDGEWLRKFKELASTYNSMTDAHVRLSKAEKTLENELTPEEERDAVLSYVYALKPEDRYTILREMNLFHSKNNGRARKWLILDEEEHGEAENE
jgi:hypothetical protein